MSFFYLIPRFVSKLDLITTMMIHSVNNVIDRPFLIYKIILLCHIFQVRTRVGQTVQFRTKSRSKQHFCGGKRYSSANQQTSSEANQKFVFGLFELRTLKFIGMLLDNPIKIPMMLVDFATKWRKKIPKIKYNFVTQNGPCWLNSRQLGLVFK